MHIHYVKKYHARLPKAFLAHVKKQVASDFEAGVLDKSSLSSEFENIVEKMSHGDESYYDDSF